MPLTEISEGMHHIPLTWEPLGDKTQIQVDMSSLQAESQAFSLMTAYRYFLTLEQSKKVTAYTISYSEVARKVDASGDTFDIKLKTPHTYKCMPEANKQVSCKTIFYNMGPLLKDSKLLMTCFRFRSLAELEFSCTDFVCLLLRL